MTMALLLSALLMLSTSAYSQNPHEFILKWGIYGTGDGQLDRPQGIGTDSGGNVYVADTYNNRIQKFTSEGVFVEWYGGGNSNYYFN